MEVWVEKHFKNVKHDLKNVVKSRLYFQELISTKFYPPGRKPKALTLSRETLN